MKVRKLLVGLLMMLPIPAVLSSPSALTSVQGRQILHDRLDQYSKAFPGIVFTHAAGGERWQREFARIESLLGQAPVALDYEHTPELETRLLSVTMARLAMMLQQNAVSETLFLADKRSPLKGSQLCVITLNLEELLHDELAATRYMLDLPDPTLAKIHPARRLDAHDFLLFTIDHEVYHCLDSAIVGGAPMTKEFYGGEFNQFRRENGADAFAMAMHLRQANSSPRFAQNIMMVRYLWFVSGTPCFSTSRSMAKIYNMPRSELAKKSLLELVHLANQVRNETAGDYQTFLDNHTVALQAAALLGLEPSEYGEIWTSIAQRKASPQRVKETAKSYNDLYERLFDDRAFKFFSK